MLIDAHCHLDAIKNFSLSSEVLPVTCGYSNKSNIKNAEIAKKLGIPFALGIAPQTALREPLEELDIWVETIKKAKPYAIGEVGLDFHWAKNAEDRKKEYHVFKRMLYLAEELRLPLVIHSRNAIGEVLRMLKERGASNFMMHFFSGTVAEAEEALSLGAYISVIMVRSKERRSVINSTPLESILVETDAPFVGKTPNDVSKSIEYVAEIKGLDFGVVAEQTKKNAVKFFNIKGL